MQLTAIHFFQRRVTAATRENPYVKSDLKKIKKNLYICFEWFLMGKNMGKKKSVFVGISGLSVELVKALRERAAENNRSVSGEMRTILETVFSQAEQSALQINTEQNQWTT